MSLSIVRGPNMPPLIERTIGEVLATTAAAHGDAAALIVANQGVRWSWIDLADRVDRMATALLDMGFAKGDRLGIWAPNCCEWVLAQFATARIGVILVNINPAYRLTEVEYALNLVGCRAVVVAPTFKSSNYIDMLRDIGEDRLPQLEYRISLGAQAHDGFISFDSLMGDKDIVRLDAIASTLSARDPINIQFTSGTTGAPKAAVLTHRNIVNNGYQVGRKIGLGPQDRVCIPVPLYHCFGMVMGNLACLTNGATMVYPGESFDPQGVLQTVADERCTTLYGVPTMFVALLNHPDFENHDLTSLRTGIMAGSLCPEPIMRQVIERMNMSEVTIAYGMTETSPVSFQTDRDDPFEERVTSVGRVHPHLEVRIIDADCNVVPRGKPGEICTRGYSVMQGYWADPVRTNEAIDAEGWMHTGDLGMIDDQGYCRITGRIKDMLIRGGENVYPREIEEFLLRLPYVLDVQVVGVPDAKFGEEICACIILKNGQQAKAEDVRAACAGKIAHYKVPRHILFLDGFPMTVTGKIQKHLLRDEAQTALGLVGHVHA